MLYISLQADDIENEANELIRIKNYLYGKLAEHTGHSVDKARNSDCVNQLPFSIMCAYCLNKFFLLCHVPVGGS